MQTSSYDLTLSPPAASFEHVDEMRARGTQPDVQELIDFLQYDPVSAAHLLRQANSPSRSGRQVVTSLDRAVTTLGFDAVCNSIYIETFARKVSGSDTPEFRRAYRYIMRISVAAAEIASGLALRLEMQERSAVRTGALIHQLGRMALLSSEAAAYPPLWKKADPDSDDVSLPPAIGREVARFGTDYMRLGAEIARHWQLPTALVEAVRYHSDPERVEGDDRQMVFVVAVSQLAARSLYESESDLDRDQSADRVENAFLELTRNFPISRGVLDDFINEAKSSAYDTSSRIKLFRTNAPEA